MLIDLGGRSQGCRRSRREQKFNQFELENCWPTKTTVQRHCQHTRDAAARRVVIGNMLLRMYQRYSESRALGRSGDIQSGDEAGTRASPCWYPRIRLRYLKAERGVHRLVRISPSTQTNAATRPLPVWTDRGVGASVEIEIKMEDVQVDTFRRPRRRSEQGRDGDSHDALADRIVVQCKTSEVSTRTASWR